MIKVAVAGITGFVGINLQKHFENHTSIFLEPINLRTGDLTALQRSKVILNLVGKAHDHHGKSTAQDFFQVNFELTRLLFEEFLKSNAEHFIHVSSIAAIEELNSDTLLTEASFANPQSPYGKSKRKAEEYLLSHQLPANKKLIMIRPTMIHGPGDKGNLALLYKFISKSIPYPLGVFHNERSFLGIDNFNYLVEKIIEKAPIIEGGVYNIADDKTLSTRQIIRTIGAVTNKNPWIISFPKKIVLAIAKIGDFLHLPINTIKITKMTSDLRISNEKIKRALGIETLPFSAKQGLEKTIKSFLVK